ncbi:hypothetical protein PF914_000978 [Salmonella enterica]|nr:hypothetical protein [Salmonella enterica]EKI7188608.1 hypothetical protein [Salmonella enterica]ELL9294357.1 hypothetical protein [Salmonella enterica]
MKLSPEAQQTIKTVIEQLRLLLVDEDDVGSPEWLKKPFIHAPVIKSASISNRLIQAANFHSFKRIYAELDKLTEEVKVLRSSNKKLKKRVNTLEGYKKAPPTQDAIEIKKADGATAVRLERSYQQRLMQEHQMR